MKFFAKFAKTNTALHPESGIGFGCMGITSFYNDVMDEDAAMVLLKTVYENGCRHFDTAELYGAEHKDTKNHNETYLGKFLKTIPRDSYSVATKFWPLPDGKYDYETVKAHLKQSLDRLQLEYVDLYFAHRVLTLEGGIEFAKAAARLKEEGLIKEVGLSEVSGNWLQQIHTKGGPIDAVQQEWSILTRTLEDELVPVCKANSIAIVAYSPLSRNLLVQKQEALPEGDARAIFPRYQNMEQNKRFANQVHDMAEKLNCTPANVCLSWLMQKAAQKGVSVIPIPGTTKLERAVGNINSVDVVLSAENMATLDAMANEVAGERYPDEFMQNGMAIETQA
ncbi:Aldo-keto reductase yakc [NADP(+)] [Seminavis robusta]|uniref:Aldo-keto reductase yakc [NADP(+)] n=1 Tax=Seminavis robusta TaxID=568900 RepID=A0A9N8H428_9STRA|nr:Aldo-keto reductase yakc [NADP(+)] [Seminavis robusta]|eukprot:Sro3_g002790.1 Aldo-keto reductase yakc [NADP(+)] (337) ;mRNA; r:243710-244720